MTRRYKRKNKKPKKTKKTKQLDFSVSVEDIYLYIKDNIDPVDSVEIGCICHCISISKLIKQTIEEIMEQYGLRKIAMNKLAEYEACDDTCPNSVPFYLILFHALNSIYGFIKAGSEKLKKDIPKQVNNDIEKLKNEVDETLKDLTEQQELLFENSQSMDHLTGPDGDKLEPDEQLYLCMTNMLMHIYNSVNLLYTNAKLCIEKIEEFRLAGKFRLDCG